MKRWIKRTLFGTAVALSLAGGIAGCAGQRHGWGSGSAADAAEFRARMVERVADRLELDAAQQQKLAALADTLATQRDAVRGSGAGDARAQFQALFAGDKLDRAAAGRLLEEKTAAVRNGGPAVIAAAGDFYDSLNPAQQQQVRAFMDRGGRR